jgi:hypothetical protein
VERPGLRRPYRTKTSPAGRLRKGHVKEFAGLKEVGARVHLQWVIYFPWVPKAGKFKGEVIYSIRPL